MGVGLGRHILGEVGISPDAEDVYQFLLGQPGATSEDIATGCDLTRVQIRTALAELERKAMVSRRSGSSSEYQPAPPDMVVEALISAREEALHKTRLDARELRSLQRVSPEQTQVTELVEVLTSREAYAERWAQLQGSTRKSLEVFVRPPFAQLQVEDSEQPQTALLGRHVASRGIYDEAALQHPGVLEHAVRMAALGEHARVVSELPMKLSLADRSTALVPFVQSDPAATVDAGLVVHKSTLLDALIALFELYWERGTELRLTGPNEVPGSRETADEDTVLTLMAAGYKDDAIASQLGVSTPTVRRRINAVQQRLKVTTRFQVGLALGRDGWRDNDAEAASNGSTSTRRRPPRSASGLNGSPRRPRYGRSL